MKYVTVILYILILPLLCHAQGKYQISGKISGVADGSTLLLVRNDGDKSDTLATGILTNGTFLLAGELDEPAAGGYLATADGNLHLGFIIEPGNTMLNVSERGALIQGGEQQKLFARYNQIGQAFAVTQVQLQAQAQHPGADIDALQVQIDQAYRQSLGSSSKGEYRSGKTQPVTGRVIINPLGMLFIGTESFGYKSKTLLRRVFFRAHITFFKACNSQFIK